MQQCTMTALVNRSAEAPHAARVALMRTLEAGDALTTFPDAALVLSELVTNAVQHTRSESIRVDIDLHDDGRLRLVVVDTAPGPVEPRVAAPGDGSGRGLRIVDQVASDWGVEVGASTKAVWAELVPRHDVDHGGAPEGTDEIRRPDPSGPP